MTIKYRFIGGSEDRQLHDVVSLRHISTHGFEALVSGSRPIDGYSRVVVKDVESLSIDFRCPCHAEER